MNVIAAIVFPLDDEALVGKFGSQSNILMLKKHERIRLWRGHGLADYFWVYNGSEGSWRAFQRQLIENVARDGFELKFSLLCGPDHMQDMETFPPEPWGCKECFFSNKLIN
jgi:hypothetical protein